MPGDEKTSLVLMVQGSHKIFCYYNISSRIIKEFQDIYGDALWINSKPVIKVYSVENGMARNIKTIFIEPFADNWYIDIERGDMDLFVKLGMIIHRNRFIEFATSNIVTTPRDSRSLDNSLCFLDVSESYISGSNKNKELSDKFQKGKKDKYPELILKDEGEYDEFIDKYVEVLENKYNLTSSRGGPK